MEKTVQLPLDNKSNIVKGRFRSIDSLRGIAALYVLFHHFLFIYNRDFGHSFVIPSFFKYGYYGVELFFIISGFVIYYTLQGTASPKVFLIKRFIRLYPTYWICLIITFILVTMFPLSLQRNTTASEAAIGLTMFQGLFGVKFVDPSYWSLQVEMFFYLMMALLLYFKFFSNIYKILWGWLLLILFYNLVHKLPGLGLFFNLRYGSLFVAGICFYKIKTRSDKSIQPFLILIASYITSLVALYDLENVIISITVIYIFFFCSLIFEPKFLKGKVLTFFGSISYALYLIHQNVGFVIMHEIQKMGFNGPLIILPAFVLCVMIASVVTFYIEKPCIRFFHRQLDRIRPRTVSVQI